MIIKLGQTRRSRELWNDWILILMSIKSTSLMFQRQRKSKDLLHSPQFDAYKTKGLLGSTHYLCLMQMERCSTLTRALNWSSLNGVSVFLDINAKNVWSQTYLANSRGVLKACNSMGWIYQAWYVTMFHPVQLLSISTQPNFIHNEAQTVYSINTVLLFL